MMKGHTEKTPRFVSEPQVQFFPTDSVVRSFQSTDHDGNLPLGKLAQDFMSGRR